MELGGAIFSDKPRYAVAMITLILLRSLVAVLAEELTNNSISMLSDHSHPMYPLLISSMACWKIHRQ